MDSLGRSSSSVDRPSTPYTPRRCNVRVSSRPAPPDCRPPIGSDPPAHAGATGGRRRPRRTPDGCRRAGDDLPPHRLLTLGQVTAPRSRACADWHRCTRARWPEGLPPGRPENPCRHLTITRSPWETSRPRSTKDRRNAGSTPARSLGVRDSTKRSRNRLSPVIEMPSATTIVASANVLPSSTRATTSSPERSRSWSSRSFVALARMNARDTFRHPDRPIAPGIASAAAA